MAEPPLWERYRTQIEALAKAPLNFDLERRHDYTAANGWHIDAYQADLPPEPPGPPLPHGPWAVAQQILRDYRFPDPGIITGIYYPDRPLEQRVMLLRGRFLFFSFFFGVRVGGVVDEQRAGTEGPEQVWGYNYQTLEGHFERGQMDFEVRKSLASGAVRFHINAFSQRAVITNPLYRLGFKLFGRPLQKRFARRSLKRMQLLVQQELAAVPQTPGTPVQPASGNTRAAQALEEIEKDT